MQFPITIGLHRSRFLDGALISITLIALGITVALPYSEIIRLLLVLLITIGSYDASRKLSPALAGIRLERSGQIFISEAGSDEFYEAELMPNATVNPRLTIIRLRPPNGRKHLLVLSADSMRSDDFRRLRVFLRWRAKFSPFVDDA
ncbi:MAG: hypothetical protein H6R13_1116 [Proteobacteria bacterium]|nr:hypothetical protein [Pseudomonadota bacterium]